LKAGGVFVMINPIYTERELSFVVNDSEAEMMITLDALWPKLSHARGDLCIKKYFITTISDWLPFPKNYLYKFKNRKAIRSYNVIYDNQSILPWTTLTQGRQTPDEVEITPETLAALQYTGGTTGEAKGVMLSHRNFCVNVYQIFNFLTPSLVNQRHMFPAVLPFFHVYGLMVTMFTPVALGAKIVPFPRFAPHDLLKCMTEERATIFGGSPAMFMSLLKTKEIKNCDLSSLKACICGSAPIPVEHLSRFREITGMGICEGYGLTEASPITHLNPVHGLQKPGSIGVPLPGTDAKIVDMELGSVEVPVGKAGELIIRGPQVMQGYWRRPDDNANTLRNGWLYTGDIATMDEDGYFYIVDRKKDMVIVGGYNVYPREIDEVLHEHPKIKEAVAVGIPHSSKGEVIKVYIVPEDDVTLTKAEVMAYCREHLAQYKVPRHVEFRKDLPRTMVGKVLRRELRAEEIEKQKNRASSAPETDSDGEE
ncbi:MAG: long-chain fatty acid--CoA ligase, partial [Desulfovibrionaceae bacterium]|nr:long-chain fatty acid--CoA ligase [Desulfovibrionaceae bacterium]